MSIQFCAGPEMKPGLVCVGDILLILGDFWPVVEREEFVDKVVRLCAAGWPYVFYVPGITESTGLEYEVVVDFLMNLEEKLDNFHLLYNCAVDMPEYKMRIFGTPLFTDMGYEENEHTVRGKEILGKFLSVNAMTSTTNHMFGIEKGAEPEKGQMYSEDADGKKHITLPLSKYWWKMNHRECRSALANAVTDASSTLPDDWTFIVATHWQPSELLDRPTEAGSAQEKQGVPVSSESLRYSVNYPLRAYTRQMDRPFVWFYAQALVHGRSKTGIPAIDEKIVFYGTPSAYQPGNEQHVIDIHQLGGASS